jgi:hypothetical protein
MEKTSLEAHQNEIERLCVLSDLLIGALRRSRFLLSLSGVATGFIDDLIGPAGAADALYVQTIGRGTRISLGVNDLPPVERYEGESDEAFKARALEAHHAK